MPAPPWKCAVEEQPFRAASPQANFNRLLAMRLLPWNVRAAAPPERQRYRGTAALQGRVNSTHFSMGL
jgi:hypothetical protein